VQKRHERNSGAEHVVVHFTAGLVGNLGQVILSPIDPKETVPEMTDSGRVYGANNDAGLLSCINRRLHIGIVRAVPVKTIYAIRDHQDLAANWSLGPSLHHVHD